ncbi:MAG TPA: hypothetical protein VMB53_11460 [Gaiellaceae bacterium]|nr:hypothetical protein [Gaiellaceae bacterium]
MAVRLPRELIVVWVLFALALDAVFATYARLPPQLLYNVSGTGFRAGLSRVVVDLNFPGALIALAVLAVVAGRLRGRMRLVAIPAALLCVVFAVPGVVRQSDLDARWINAIAAAGVAVVFVLSLVADGPESPRRARGDRLRIVLAAVLTILAAPWIAAELGFYLDGVPVLGWMFQTGKLVSFHDPPHPAVHHGVHHGLQGLLFVVTALLLSRLPSPQAARAFLAVLLAYGVANMANDGWLEQVVERGWSSHPIPSVLGFGLNWLWLAVLLAGAAVWALWFRQSPGAGGGDG